MTTIANALRAVNHRLLIVAGVLFALGLIWAAWVAAGEPGRNDEFRGSTSGGAMTNDSAAAYPPMPMPDQGTGSGPTMGGVTAPESAQRGEGGDGGGSFTLPNVLGRTVIRSGHMELAVGSVPESFERVRLLAETAGGFVADSTIYGRGDQERATLVLRVPAERFSQVVEDLRGLAVEVVSLSTSAQDVTEQYADLQATLRNLTAVESQYLELLGRTESIGEVLQVQDRLNQVRLQIEQVQGRINLLDELTTLASVTVMLTPDDNGAPSTGSDSLGDAVREAWEASLETLSAIARGVIVVVVYSWWLVPVVLVGALGVRRLVRDRARVDTPEGSA